VIAWWQRKSVIVPATLLGTGVVVTTGDEPEPSPSRPPAQP